MIQKLLKIARIDHWLKNILIIPGMAFAIFFIHTNIIDCIIPAIFSILATCFAASANYIMNEYLDSDFDKYHPTKKNRTLVIEKIKFRYILLDYLFFALLSILIAYNISKYILYCILFLLIMGILYNVPPIRLKDIVYVDILSESINSIIRLLIGWFIVTTEFLPPISIVIGYWMCGAFLMSVKRYAEYRMIADKTMAYLYRKSFKKYNEEKLLLLSIFFAITSVFFCGIFVVKYHVELIISIPFISALFCYYLSLSYKKDSVVQKPEKLYKEKELMLFCLLIVLLIIFLMSIKIDCLKYFLTTELINF